MVEDNAKTTELCISQDVCKMSVNLLFSILRLTSSSLNRMSTSTLLKALFQLDGQARLGVSIPTSQTTSGLSSVGHASGVSPGARNAVSRQCSCTACGARATEQRVLSPSSAQSDGSSGTPTDRVAQAS